MTVSYYSLTFFSIMEKISFLVGFILIFNDVYGSINIGMYT